MLTSVVTPGGRRVGVHEAGVLDAVRPGGGSHEEVLVLLRGGQAGGQLRDPVGVAGDVAGGGVEGGNHLQQGHDAGASGWSHLLPREVGDGLMADIAPGPYWLWNKEQKQ